MVNPKAAPLSLSVRFLTLARSREAGERVSFRSLLGLFFLRLTLVWVLNPRSRAP